MVEWLGRPFQVEEVKEAIFDCDGNAPGSDGFHNEGLLTMLKSCLR